ncbi:MAG: hypothetical protein K8R59_07980 [Thermoanaerobaculales bacterium]|nr:hypothetical protein [Thermoanaerobaculales bacterium]
MNTLRVVYTSEEIQNRIVELAQSIAEDYGEKPLVLVGILKGAAFFLADLARAFPGPVDFEFVDVDQSPGDRGEVVQLTYATQIDVRGRHVLVLKDVVHSGITENYLITHLSQQRPESIEVVALVDRPQYRSVNLATKYAAFTNLPEGFLVGYGLGPGRNQYTNRPDLCLLEEE